MPRAKVVTELEMEIVPYVEEGWAPIYDEVNDTFLYGGTLIDTPIFDDLQKEHQELETEYKPTAEQLAREIVARKLAQVAPEADVALTYTAYTRDMAAQVKALADADKLVRSLPSEPYQLVDDGDGHEVHYDDMPTAAALTYQTEVLGIINEGMPDGFTMALPAVREDQDE